MFSDLPGPGRIGDVLTGAPLRAQTWARRAFRNLIYFHDADRGGHFAMGEHPQLFAAELRAAFRSLRGAP